MNSNSEIKYCMVGFIDLQGFSSHLEVSSDLRTIIGQQAIKRLQTLENFLRFLIKEQHNTSCSFPCKRINDSIIVTIDLNDVLLPDIGDTYKSALTNAEWKEHYDIGDNDIDETFDEKYSKKRKEYTLPVIKFIGLVSRIHQLINIEERASAFPGTKTIISTGFRRRFVGLDGEEDSFSANFAFSNAYKAQEALRGAGLFVDNNIIQMLDADPQIKNIAKLACLTYHHPVYSPLKGLKESDKVWADDEIVEVSLFRKQYHFRKINPNPLTYLQFVDNLGDRDDMYRVIVEEIKTENIDERIRNGEDFKILKLPYDMGKRLKTEKRNCRQFNTEPTEI